MQPGGERLWIGDSGETPQAGAILRTARTPVLVLANKIDDPAQESLALDLHRLGLGEPLPVSALHGHGSGDLLDLIGVGDAVGHDQPFGVEVLGQLA